VSNSSIVDMVAIIIIAHMATDFHMVEKCRLHFRHL